jgi:uncharacterized membrane protein YeaQ/YmgE (transglycosylase-associated protein family)
MLGVVILGIVAGFLGRLLMPGRDKMGLIATTVLGIAGAAVGWAIFTFVLGIGHTDLIDFRSLIGAVVGVMLLLGLHRAYVHHESGHGLGHRSGHGFGT